MIYVWVVVLLGGLIFFHELGHFLAALIAGIPVERFSLGFGSKLWAIRWKGTEYRLSWVPLGGYVLPAVKDEEEFFQLPVSKRLLFVLAGPVANILLAIVLLYLAAAFKTGFSFQLLGEASIKTWDLFIRIFASLPSVFAHPGELSGAIGIVAQGGKIMAGGLTRTLTFAAVLSLNLAVFNLLPIPGLDGGKLILFLLEKIHPKLSKLQMPLTIAGLIALVGLMLYATFQDVLKLI